ncbi:Glyoxalase/Bleomycin resistance protein/Dihydroxybiphenyl dioxygenase [Lobosporangium transversale]|uniref:Glyoxalase/Bleomycin resistance protein/Dihydroxybiphenyl dioxygenase n=1 Tax=Lobosporangium transversale TaxID=64571 RepID=A0A1Y2GUQ5_9FUNG|nr:Glyoxalase/Bleomycin resistance protein/Dihydroxybiphenyl dioxygenase [Lobosporangium transversale]ORZ19161.1 Glyoxalase/Bleomycin resistance protein/Dihydroxybiphenyl dioxygenase [Lobosporangium transversale]|eukprot:XP_021882329.1 Glyoxalase/Bleomycin resistance protein/Dihydroxybiphenyl dioxygenase [Lobosporangium transversale]
MAKLGTLSHISLSVSDYEQGKKFYSFLLVDLLGYKLITEHPYFTMWALQTGECICISPGNKTPHHKSNPGLHHLAFNTETHEQIDELYNKVVQFQEANKEMSGSVILDKPALYPQYGEGYYAVFFTDPDGIKLELAYTPSYLK